MDHLLCLYLSYPFLSTIKKGVKKTFAQIIKNPNLSDWMAKENLEPNPKIKSQTTILSYLVSILDINRHYFSVKLTVHSSDPKPIFSLPNWTPGSYMIRDYVTHLHKFYVKNIKTGENIAYEMLDQNRWLIDTNLSEFQIEYIIYAFEDYTVRTNYLTNEFGFINPPAMFLYKENSLDSEVTVEFDVDNFFPNIYTSLERTSKQKFKAIDFDELYDSPFHLTIWNSLFFESGGTKHELLIEGDIGFDFKTKLTNDLQKITETQIQWMGSSPNEYYLFVVNLSMPSYGGLEHKKSSINFFNPELIGDDDEYKRLLELLSHEYFHLWNVKRIRPIALGPFDYQKPNLTKELWIAEGVTSFYDMYFLYLSGFLTRDEYISRFQSDIFALEETEGEDWMSLEESSFTAWTKYYKRNANSHNTTVSYYTKGGVLVLCMNIFLLEQSEGKFSLKQIYNRLYNLYAVEKGRGFTKQEFFEVCEEVTGINLKLEFNEYLEKPKKIPVALYLSKIGLQKMESDPIGDFGFKLKEKNGNLFVQKIIHKSETNSIQLQIDDEIIAVNGKRVNLTAFQRFEKQALPGEKFHLTIARNNKLRETIIEVTTSFKVKKLVTIQNPTENQKRMSSYFFENQI
ncbi:M61 family peptidase [Leptospira sp. 96542]|nr:M61 family peptidase [Leptospira sp. 96542]